MDHWRFFLFVAIATLSTVVGFYFKSAAQPLEFPRPEPASVEVYTNHPNEGINLGLLISPPGTDELGVKRHASATVYMSTPNTQPDDQWVIVIRPNVPVPQDELIQQPRLKLIPIASARGTSVANYLVEVITPRDLGESLLFHLKGLDYYQDYKETNFQGMWPLIKYDIDDKVDIERGGDIALFLPRIGLAEVNALPTPLESRFGLNLSAPQEPTAGGFDPFSTAHTPQFVPYQQLYFGPSSISVYQRIDGVGDLGHDTQVTSVIPSDAQIAGSSITWSGHGILEPSLQASSSVGRENRSTADFYSGLALATAAGVLIAAIQELPSKLPPRWLLRRLSIARNDEENKRKQSAP